MSGSGWALAILGAGLGTYFLRVAPFALNSLRHLGERYLHFLTYVSFAIAAGIISKALLVSGGSIQFDVDLFIKLAALATAILLQRIFRNLPTALFAGVALAVGIKWLLG